MNNSEKLSRRDWFRLRLRRSLADPASETEPPDVAPAREPSLGRGPAGMTYIPHPQNHDGLDLSELPPMREAVLSRQQVAGLFSDIETLGTDILLMQRAGSARATASAASSKEQLRTACGSLLSGAIARLQIRYQWQNAAWIDTLECRPEGFRLIRIAHRGGPGRAG